MGEATALIYSLLWRRCSQADERWRFSRGGGGGSVIAIGHACWYGGGHGGGGARGSLLGVGVSTVVSGTDQCNKGKVSAL